MQHTYRQTFVVLFALLCFPAILFAESSIDGPSGSGSVGVTDSGDSEAGRPTEPGAEEFSPAPGLLGRVDDRDPHPACETCFTVPGVGDGYAVFERLGLGDDEILLPRRIPNPAPVQDSERRPLVDEETGEDIWYIGTQGFIGPTDEDYWSEGAPRPTIALKRIQMRHVDAILGIPGVHAFGIGPLGFVVQIDPIDADQAEAVPSMIENVPVTVELTEMATLHNHITTRFRPIPAGAGIAVRIPTPTGGTVIGGGTLGPHVVRDTPIVSSCCTIWSLTAAHVVQYEVSDPAPAPASRFVYQPYSSSPPSSDFVGSVAHAFRLSSCSPIEYCESSAATNWTHINPDIAAVDMGHYSYPSNTPVGTDPTRRLQKSGTATDYINGPSGRIREAEYGHKHKVWGAQAQYQTVYVIGLNTCSIVENDNTGTLYRICGMNRVGLGSYSGDSGSLVAYEGTGDRHVAGVLVAGSSLASYYIPANDIQIAFDDANKPFSHFWGTQSDYRRPANKTCDFPGC